MDWKDLLEDLVAVVQQTAPELWRIANRQVYGDVARSILWIAFGILALYVCVRVIKYGKKQVDDNYMSAWEIGLVFSCVGTAIVALLIVIGLDSLISRIINPEYYAIKALMALIK